MANLEYAEMAAGSAFALKMVLFLLMYLVASMEFFWTSYSIPIIGARDDGHYYIMLLNQNMASILDKQRLSTAAGTVLILFLGIALGFNDFFLRWLNY